MQKEVNTNEAFCTVTRTRLQKHSLVMGAEVDCCLKSFRDKPSFKPPKNYIELKTTRIMQYYKQKQNFARYKLLKFWAQSFLAGLPRVIVGERDDDGVVLELKTYDTMQIPSQARQFSSDWNASVCLNFLDKFLSWMKEIVVEDNPDSVYMFYFNEPFDKITVTFSSDGHERFLPEWFTNFSE